MLEEFAPLVIDLVSMVIFRYVSHPTCLAELGILFLQVAELEGLFPVFAVQDFDLPSEVFDVVLQVPVVFLGFLEGCMLGCVFGGLFEGFDDDCPGFCLFGVFLRW